jgi:putative ABC transport system permease protein
MNFNKVIQIAWKGLTRNKMRSILTMLGVIIGVAAVIVMVSVSDGTEKAIASEIEGLGTNLIFIQSSFQRGGFGPGRQPGGGDTGGLKYDDAAAIAKGIDGVAGVVVEQQTMETIKAGNVTITDVTILGTTTDFPSVRDMSIVNGRYFKDEEIERSVKVAVLGYSLAEELFGTTNPVGQIITAGSIKLTVVGVFEERGLVGEIDYDMRLYIPITVVFDKFLPSQFARIMGDSVRMLYVELDDGVQMNEVILQIELLLAKRHDVSLEEPDFSITTQQDIILMQESTTAAFRSLLGWVAAVSLLVGGIGIMNIMLVSVTERTREIGIRQAVGATPNDIRLQFLAEALMLSLIGGFVGVGVGIAGSWLFGWLGDMPTVVSVSSIAIAFGSAAAVGIFFGYYPANNAARLDPIEALRYE